MSSRKRPPAGDDEDDDARLWEDVTRSVKPIARRNIVPEAAAPAPASRTPEPEKEPAAAQAGKRRVDIANLKIGARDRPAQGPGAKSGPARLGLGDAPGVDRRTALRFQRGLMPIEAKLDLHGHTRESGRQALTGFLRAHRAAGRRCVLVVTGKGLKDDWSVGALRQALPGWLNAPDLRRLILAFCHAQPQHGGSGAVYILLRRERGGRGREGD